MKKLFIVLLAFLVSHASPAQSETGSASFEKNSESAVISNLNFSEEAVNNGLQARMSKWGKPKKVKNYTMYRNVSIPDISSAPVTLYFSVAKKDREQSTLSMLISNEFDRFYKVEEQPELFGKARDFLNGFREPVAAASLELQITAQDDNVKKQEKKVKKLKDDSADIEKQKKKLEEKIAQNIKDIEQQEKELLTQKEQLDGLIRQRKN